MEYLVVSMEAALLELEYCFGGGIWDCEEK